MPSNPQGQHYVPQFYLRHFAFSPKKKSQIYVHDLHDRNRVFTTSIKNVAQERGFYQLSSGHSIEPILAELEGQIANVWKILAKGNLDELTQVERIWIAVFVCTLMVRTSATKETYRDMLIGIREHFEKYEIRAAPELSEQLNFHEDEATSIVASQLVNSLQWFPMLLNFHWMLGTPPPGRLFPTSDNPVVKHNSINPGSLGLASSGIELHLPVSSGLVLIMVDNPSALRDKLPQRFAYTRDTLVHLTHLLVESSSRYLFSQDGQIEFDKGMLRKGPRVVTN